LPLLFSLPPQAHAGEVGARITKAVTTSDLGISVRRAVVQGAQMADSIDAQWEQFSDRFHLGAARKSKAAYNNKAAKDNLILNQPHYPLDVNMASKLLDISNQSFLESTRKYGRIQAKDLEQQIDKVARMVLPSFERAAGSKTNDNIIRTTSIPPISTSSFLTLTTPFESISSSSLSSKPSPFSTAASVDQFNFLCYTQYKAYLDLILQNDDDGGAVGIDFQSFSNDFESRVGSQVLNLLLASSSSLKQESIQQQQQQQLRSMQLALALDGIDQLSQVLVDKGFMSRIDISLPRRPGETSNKEYSSSKNDKKMRQLQQQEQEEDLLDWTEGLTDYLQWSIALNEDISLGSQLLLQEQGFRLYPSFARCAITSLLKQTFSSDKDSDITVEVSDYYMDTNYNSDPNKFEVKQVLLNIVLDTK
jgi:hypothetical protein